MKKNIITQLMNGFTIQTFWNEEDQLYSTRTVDVNMEQVGASDYDREWPDAVAHHGARVEVAQR